MTTVAMRHTLLETIATPTDLLKALTVKHDYYHSSDTDGDTYDGINAFLESWKSYDIDLNRVIRWDIRNVSDVFGVGEMDDECIRLYGYPGSQYAELHFCAPRKGHTFTNRIKNLKSGDIPRLYLFLKKHWEHTQKLWDPLPNIEYVPPSTPRSRFLELIHAVGSRYRLPAEPGGNYVGDDIVRRVNGTIEGVLQVIDTNYLLFEKQDEINGPLDPIFNIAGELAKTYFDEINS